MKKETVSRFIGFSIEICVFILFTMMGYFLDVLSTNNFEKVSQPCEDGKGSVIVGQECYGVKNYYNFTALFALCAVILGMAVSFGYHIDRS